jgi:formylglycine-generating enzyme required for sulfatase activity
MGGSFGGDACMNAALDEELAGLVVIASPEPAPLQKRYPEDLASPTMPKLFIVTEQDFTQVTAAMSLLYEVSPEPKQIKIFPGTVHGTELFDARYGGDFRALLVNFLDGLPPTSAPDSTPAGTTRIRSTDDMVMIYVPAGEFQMGIDANGEDYAQQLCKDYSGDMAVASGVCQRGFKNEQPAHTVVLDSFWIDRTEVSNGQYRRCVEAGDCDPPVENGSHTRDSYYGNSAYDDYPVIWVRWDQAADYCAWAGGRLPTEAEWEYAARGPRGLTFPWGDTFDGTLLNYCDVDCDGVNDETVDDGYPDTAPVGSFPAGVSWCGALDMAGNVREWVADWFGYYSSRRQVNPTGPSLGDSRIPRGGSWYDTPDDVRSANRGENSPDYTRHKVGFRCASSVLL